MGNIENIMVRFCQNETNADVSWYPYVHAGTVLKSEKPSGKNMKNFLPMFA